MHRESRNKQLWILSIKGIDRYIIQWSFWFISWQIFYITNILIIIENLCAKTPRNLSDILPKRHIWQITCILLISKYIVKCWWFWICYKCIFFRVYFRQQSNLTAFRSRVSYFFVPVQFIWIMRYVKLADSDHDFPCFLKSVSALKNVTLLTYKSHVISHFPMAFLFDFFSWRQWSSHGNSKRIVSGVIYDAYHMRFVI